MLTLALVALALFLLRRWVVGAIFIALVATAAHGGEVAPCTDRERAVMSVPTISECTAILQAIEDRTRSQNYPPEREWTVARTAKLRLDGQWDALLPYELQTIQQLYGLKKLHEEAARGDFTDAEWERGKQQLEEIKMILARKLTERKP
jgi:hypothetical protein